MKGGYFTENFFYYTKLNRGDKNHTQLNQNDHSESTKEE